VAFVDQLVSVMVRADHVGAWELLDSLEGEELREAKEWFALSARDNSDGVDRRSWTPAGDASPASLQFPRASGETDADPYEAQFPLDTLSFDSSPRAAARRTWSAVSA
jgi:hypothetical protein